MTERLFRYLYSSANLWGSLAGLAGLGLLFGGVIQAGWLYIVGGLYLAAALIAPRPRATGVVLHENLGADEIKARLNRLIDAAQRAGVRGQALQDLGSIRDQALELLPKIDKVEGTSDKDVFQLRETVFRYLPETVDAYLKLPPLYRQYHAIRDGKTAEALFAEQVALLAHEVGEAGARIYQAEAQGLLAQGRFLDDKFRKPADFQAVPSAQRS